MSHKGRCFRSARSTRRRKEAQGKTYDFPIRWKVPAVIRPFLSGPSTQARATYDIMGTAIARYMQHRQATGHGPQVKVVDSGDRIPG